MAENKQQERLELNGGAENLALYNAVRKVPTEAQKRIAGGRLKGMTDINPMWRIKTLTEQFGACGDGWYIEVTDVTETPVSGGEIVVNMRINLYVRFKRGGEWSKPIPGFGGDKLVKSEKNELYNNDEAYKSAMTDAIGSACKLLGVAADVYFASDVTKYSSNETRQVAMPNEFQLKAAANVGIDMQRLADYLKKPVEEINSEELAAAIQQKKSYIEKQRKSGENTVIKEAEPIGGEELEEDEV